MRRRGALRLAGALAALNNEEFLERVEPDPVSTSDEECNVLCTISGDEEPLDRLDFFRSSPFPSVSLLHGGSPL